MIPPQPIQVNCPQCRQPFIAHIYSVIDVGERPEFKEQLLRGRLNLATCPYCGGQAMLGAPLLYHDPAKELLLCLVPMELNLNREEQERLIGTMTNALMEALPPEKRKAYLLQPKTVFSLQRLAEEILQADGITREMLDEQARRAQLIQDLLVCLDDEERLKALVEERRGELGYEFFLMLAASMNAAWEDGDKIRTQRLSRLREKLLELTGPILEPLPEGATYEDLIRALLEAEGEAQLWGLAIANRHFLDYGFFQTLTGQIEAAQAAEETELAQRLTELRAKVLEIADELDRQARAAMERAADLLRRILDSDDPRGTIQEHIEDIDEVFLFVLSANIAQARAEKREEIAKGLEVLYGYILAQLEARMPPEMQLVNRLLRAEDAQAREELLRQESALVDQQFLGLVQAVADDAQRQGQAEMATCLQEIGEQVEKMLEGAG
ncbi:MAG: CpXC domain-containing protein [Anaerolineae bacterium]